MSTYGHGEWIRIERQSLALDFRRETTEETEQIGHDRGLDTTLSTNSLACLEGH